jgi:hypothetical protein
MTKGGTKGSAAAEKHKRRIAAVDVHRHGPASAGTDNHVGLPTVELGLGDADGGIKVVVGKGGVQDLMAVVLEVSRLQAARCRQPEEESRNRPNTCHPQRITVRESSPCTNRPNSSWGWGTLSLIDAGLAQSKGRSGLLWW